jgi:hypothetical protein
MRRGSRLAAVSCAVIVGGATAGVAFAGEITGNGKPVPAPHIAQSECSFSGFNDDPNEAFPFGGTAQSYGRLVAQLGKEATNEMFPSPGVACRGTP